MRSRTAQNPRTQSGGARWGCCRWGASITLGALSLLCRRLCPLIKPRLLDLAPDKGLGPPLANQGGRRATRRAMEGEASMLNADSREALAELSQAVGEPVSDVAAWRRAKLDSDGCEVSEM